MVRRYDNTSFQERQYMNFETDIDFWDSVPLLEKGAQFIMRVCVRDPENHIKERVKHWLDEFFQGEPKYISQRDCENFLEENEDFRGHEPAMVLALARVITRVRKKH